MINLFIIPYFLYFKRIDHSLVLFTYYNFIFRKWQKVHLLDINYFPIKFERKFVINCSPMPIKKLELITPKWPDNIMFQGQQL